MGGLTGLNVPADALVIPTNDGFKESALYLLPVNLSVLESTLNT